MAIKNIIWDWNGTIVDDAYLFVEIMNKTLQKNGLPKISIQDYRNKFCFPIKKYWNHLGFLFDDALFNIMNKEFLLLYQKKMHYPLLQKNILSVFKTFKKCGFEQFVLSASEHRILNLLVSQYKISHYFSDVLGVDNLNALGKERLGNSLMKKHLLSPNESLIVGDTEYDFRVAKALGCRCVLVACGHFSKDRLLDCGADVVDSVDELLKFI